jgi:hypothetical protein
MFHIQLVDDVANHGDIDTHSSSEDDTKKSFNFTGELKKLNESGASERRSFVEQLESAFRTPAKIDLRDGVGDKLQNGFVATGSEVPPVPKLPDYGSETVKKGNGSTASSTSAMDSFSQSRIVDVQETTNLRGQDSSSSTNDSAGQLQVNDSALAVSDVSFMAAQPSLGQLNKEFKFGGTPLPAERAQTTGQGKPLTLSDIIPPPSRCHTYNRSNSDSSIIDEDSSVLNSIFAKAAGIPTPAHVPPLPRQRLHSDSSSKRQARNVSNS